MVENAEALEIPWCGGATVCEGDDVVDLAIGCRYGAPGDSAREIPATDVELHLLGGGVVRGLFKSDRLDIS